jgi:hypothetical protein
MLSILRGKDNRIKFSGNIDGTEDLSVMLGKLASGVTIDCADVTQINSTGIKAWMRYFCGHDKKDLDIRFENFSIPLVEQLNMFRNFNGSAKVISMALPFRCEPCNHNFSKVFKVEETEPFKTSNATVPCPQCNGPAQFDDLPDEYFEFLSR